MARGCEEFLSELCAELILPVPLHPKRLRWRGFNQSVLLARQVSRAYNTPMDPFVLVRRRETPPQTQLTEEERRKNMRGAFAVNPNKPIKNKAILLIDDVYTSGATVNECSRTLRRAGAKNVYILTLARAV
jgi:ComF family protein